MRKRGQGKGNSSGRNRGRNQSRGLFNANDDIGILCKHNQRLNVIFQIRDALAFFESGRKRIRLRYSASNNVGAQIGKRQTDHLGREIATELENTQTCQGARLARVVGHLVAVGHPTSTLSIHIDVSYGPGSDGAAALRVKVQALSLDASRCSILATTSRIDSVLALPM